jgi:acyl dehydratase
MPIDYPAVMSLREENRAFAWDERDAMLYALGFGMGSDPMDEAELRFVYERGLRVVPTFATVAAWGAGISAEQIGLDRRRTLHGEEHTRFHRPMPPSASIVADSRVVSVIDKGADKGAVVERQTTLFDAVDREPIATITRTAFARGDGGFGGPAVESALAPMRPSRAPDVMVELSTRPDLALLYRLSGDRNPLHADPGVARAAGFERPILHGLCTYGLACRAVLRAFCDYDPSALAGIGARFSAPVVPGDTIRFDLWRDGDDVFFEGRVEARDSVVMKNGHAKLS